MIKRTDHAQAEQAREQGGLLTQEDPARRCSAMCAPFAEISKRSVERDVVLASIQTFQG